VCHSNEIVHCLYSVFGIHTARFSNITILTFALGTVVLIVGHADFFLPTRRIFHLTDALKIINDHSAINLKLSLRVPFDKKKNYFRELMVHYYLFITKFLFKSRNYKKI